MGPHVITPRPTPIDPSAAAPFDAKQMARELLRTSRSVALATLDGQSGYPYSTITNLSVEPDGTVIFYAARVSLHARNILGNPRVSMTMARLDGLDVLSEGRLTLVGEAVQMTGRAAEAAKSRYKRRFPKASVYLGFQDALVFTLEVRGIHLNGGAARNTDTLTPADLRTDLSGAEDLIEHEEEEIARLQNDRDMLAFLAERAGGVRGRWRIATLDPEGIDMAAEGALRRLWLPRRVTSRADLQELLAQCLGLAKL